MNRDHLKHVGGWLNDLAALVASNLPASEVRTKVAAMAGMLADDYPSGAFTRDSLREIAQECTFFPSYRELSDKLGKWWFSHNPVKDLADLPDMPMADRCMVGFWRQYRGGRAFPEGVTFSTWLSMCRKPCPAAFAHIVKTDAFAEDIARQHKWLEWIKPPMPSGPYEVTTVPDWVGEGRIGR